MRLPLAIPLDARSGSDDSDGRMVNMVAEQYDELVLVGPRPGLDRLSEVSGAALGVVCFGGSLVNLFGTTVYVSYNTEWTIGALGASAIVKGVAYGSSRFVAVTDDNSNRSFISTDGITWSAGGTMPLGDDWRKVAFGNSTFVSIATAQNRAATSADGTSWTNRTLPSTQNWYDIAFGGGNFVTIAQSVTNAAYSTDNGATWNAASTPSAVAWTAIAYGNSTFVAVAFNSAVSATSPTGATWSPQR